MASPLESRVRLLEDAAAQRQHRRNLVVIVPRKEGALPQGPDEVEMTDGPRPGVLVRTRMVDVADLISA